MKNHGKSAADHAKLSLNYAPRKSGLKEEIELTGKVQSAQVKQARQSLEEAMQGLDQSGGLVMME